MSHSGRLSRVSHFYGTVARAGGVGAPVLYTKTAIGDPIVITDGVAGTSVISLKCSLLATQAGTPTPEVPIQIVGVSSVSISRDEDSSNWSSDLDGVVYDGTIDLVSGEIIITCAYSSSPSWTLRSSGTEHPWIRISGSFPVATPTSRSKWMCNKAVTVVSNGSGVPSAAYDGKSIWQYDSKTARIYLPSGSGSDAAAELMDGLAIVYPLKTPIIRSVSPVEIAMLTGANTFHGDCGQMEMKYYWMGA